MPDTTALRAARDWAATHLREQPDDQMLRAYGRVLLAGLADQLQALATQRRAEAQRYAGLADPHPVGVEKRTQARAYAEIATVLTEALADAPRPGA